MQAEATWLAAGGNSRISLLAPEASACGSLEVAFPSARRRGVTILEVLFAMGIVIIGILGIASLLPVAARNANQANEAADGQSYSLRYYAEFMTRGFYQPSRWAWFNDQSGATTVTGKFETFDLTAAVPSGTSIASTRTAYRHAVCIDPSFFSDATTLSTLTTSTFPPSQAYRPGLFPYYQDNYDPLSNPFSSSSSPSFYPTSASDPDRPRLLRVSLQDPFAGLFTAAMINELFLSGDDLAITRNDKDRTLPAQRVFSPGAAKSLATSQYTWLATLCPREPTSSAGGSRAETKYTLSIVVMHRRDRAFFAPAGPDKNSIPQGERLVAVLNPDAPTTLPPTNFIGGSGGRVMLSANLGIDDRVSMGDWVMLARHVTSSRATVVRWYRVIGIDEEPEIGDTFWTQTVMLDGPDWAFDADFPTQATLLSNVVTVLERVVDIES